MHIFLTCEVRIINADTLVMSTQLSSLCAHLSPVDFLPLTLMHHISTVPLPFHFDTLHIDKVHIHLIGEIPIVFVPLSSPTFHHKDVNPSSSPSTSITTLFLSPMLTQSTMSTSVLRPILSSSSSNPSCCARQSLS